MSATPERVAAVIVTYNRADLLAKTLAGLAAQTRPLDAIIVINNASTDHTAQTLADHPHLPLEVVHSAENTGGAGGFSQGVRLGYQRGYDRLWVMDDDVRPAPDCLATLLAVGEPLLVCVREDSRGQLVEKAAIRFDLANPFAIRPKRHSIDSTYARRADMPAVLPVQNFAFEGVLIHRQVCDAVGFPDPSYFIFYDDVDFAIRARQAGFVPLAVRDARLVRMLDFDQQHALDTWKGYYMYRNLFVVHFRYGQNWLVRLKPYAITAGVLLLCPLRGGVAEGRNVYRAIRDAKKLPNLATI